MSCRRRSPSIAWLVSALVATTVRPAVAATGFELEDLHLRPEGLGVLAVPTPTDLPAGGLSLALTLGAVGRPLALRPVTATDPRAEGAVIERRIAAALAGAYTPWDGVAVWGEWPLTMATVAGGFAAAGGSTQLTGLAAGDLRLGLDVSPLRLAGFAQPRLDVAFGVTGVLPTGEAAALTGEGAFRFEPHVAVDARLGPVLVTADVAWLFRPAAVAYNVRKDDTLRAGLGVDLALPLGFAALGSVTVARSFAAQPDPLDPTRDLPAADAPTAPVEALLGARFQTVGGLGLTLAGGRGLTDAPGSPAWRALLRLSYATPATAATPAPESELDGDVDGDGVPDATDDCPDLAETVNGIRDTDGCPEGVPVGTGASNDVVGPAATLAPLAPLPPLVRALDSDGDGLADEVDSCPQAPEDRDGYDDGDGCPDPDNDGDGVADTADRCPAAAEVPNGVEDGDGCPDVGPDADGDGVEDRVDDCPLLPETLNGLRDEDGCPDGPPAGVPLAPLRALPPLLPASAAEDAPSTAPDPDGDGIVGALDRCPTVAENRNGLDDLDGCPDLGPDSDGDGVADLVDACPAAAESPNGVRDEDGCPEFEPPVGAASFTPVTPLRVLPPLPVAADADGDGIAGEDDLCPADAEDLDGFADADGCPEPDNDLDGVPDDSDNCPGVAETPNAFQDEDGCPDAIPQDSVDVVGAVSGIQFETGAAVLTAASRPILDRVAAALRAHPDWRLQIEGHTDDAGPRAANVELSARRAQAVRDALVVRGITPMRLGVSGFGPDRPVAPNATPAGRGLNRRVELHYAGAEPPKSPETPPKTEKATP